MRPGGTQADGRVYWAETLGEELDVAPALTRPVTTDVCVVGGGFAGLWTAIEVKRRHPDVDVVLVEAAVCGAGASGRNGGWATSYWRRFDGLQARFGTERALRLAEAAAEAVEDIGAFVAEHGIDCHWRQEGGLWAATADHAGGAPWQGAVDAVTRVGRGDRLEQLTAERVRALTGCGLLHGAVRHVDSAAVHPARLVRGLRRIAREWGVRMYEATPMTGLDRGSTPLVHTPMGRVSAGQVILTLGAWSAVVPELRRVFVSVGSHVAVTEPLGDAVARLGWSSGLLLGDDQISVHYAQVTPDRRIVFGRGLGSVGPGSKVTARHLNDPATQATVVRDLRQFFPQFAGAAITHAWGGAVDRTPHALPVIDDLDGQGTVHYVVGFSGQGVAQSLLAARVLCSLATGARDDYAACPLIGPPPAYCPPEPLRYVGATAIKQAVQACERRIAQGRGSPVPRHVLQRLVSAYVPRLLDPRCWSDNRRPNGDGGQR